MHHTVSPSLFQGKGHLELPPAFIKGVLVLGGQPFHVRLKLQRQFLLFPCIHPLQIAVQGAVIIIEVGKGAGILLYLADTLTHLAQYVGPVMAYL